MNRIKTLLRSSFWYSLRLEIPQNRFKISQKFNINGIWLSAFSL